MSAQFDELDLLVHLAQGFSPGLFVDVGASIGRFSERFSSLGWRVVAFEPAPDLAQEFRERVRGDRVRLLERAVSDVNDAGVAFFLSSEHWGIHSLTPFHETHTKQIEVATIRLDTALDVDEYVDPVFLKIDAEGADFAALQSWDFTIHRPRVALVEFMDARSRPAYGYGYEDVVDFMTARGYAAYVCEWTPIREYSRRGVDLADSPDFVGVFQPPLRHTPDWGNLLFVDRGRDEQFETALVRYLSDVAVHSGRVLRAAEKHADQAEHLSASLSNREARLLTLSEAVQQRDRRIQELDAAVQQRDRRIQELDAAVQQRDRRIQELDAAVQQRDMRFQGLDSANAKLDQRLSDLNLNLNMEDQVKPLNRSIMNRLWATLSRSRRGS